MTSGHPHAGRRLLRLASLALLASSALTISSLGQAAPAASTGPSLSRVDIFGGYAYFSPFTSDIANVKYPTVPYGAVGSVTGYFGRYLGLQAEGNYAPNGPHDNNCVYTAQAGPILRYQKGRFVPFFHALGGGAIVGGPLGQKCNVWGWGVTGGVGFDVILPIFHDHLALRPIQADFMYSDINNGPQMAGGFTGGVGQIYAIRASAGIVLRFGDMKPVGVEEPPFNCSADPGNPLPGDPVMLTASTMNINPKLNPHYIWASSGGVVGGTGPSAAIDTTGMQPGTYAVTGKLVEGDKQRLVASCTTSFTVRPFEPPTVACAADKAAINSGDSVAITATARSPQNRPLIYGYKATSGLIVGNGPTAGLSTAGVTPGNITVTCTVSDDKGQSVSASTSIVVATPPPPPVLPQAQSLCTITFDRDLKRPDRVDNEAKGCLDDVALTLNRETADKLLLIGSHVAGESNRNAAERAMNAAQYLTQEKGVDPSRLDLRIGPNNSRAVSMMLVPPGAVVDTGTATSFDTSSVQRTGQAYGTGTKPPPTTHRRKRKPAPPPTPPQ